MAESRDDRQQRLSLAVRDNRARVWHARLPTLLALEIEPSSFRPSAEVADVEALVAERRTDFYGVSRRRWTIDLQAEAIATLRRLSAVDQPVVLMGVEPGEFFAVALTNASFLQQAQALVDAVPYFAVVAESGNGGLIFEGSWTDPGEGEWSELATWGTSSGCRFEAAAIVWRWSLRRLWVAVCAAPAADWEQQRDHHRRVVAAGASGSAGYRRNATTLRSSDVRNEAGTRGASTCPCGRRGADWRSLPRSS